MLEIQATRGTSSSLRHRHMGNNHRRKTSDRNCENSSVSGVGGMSLAPSPLACFSGMAGVSAGKGTRAAGFAIARVSYKVAVNSTPNEAQL